ncbi:hypothetical protein ASC77_20415 [Nocardioides sp. Root1257]|nr:hypothetical protein ASC77_20415 [Nocardioides sp. Root1257]KRC45851.1 hypothetical protein ASE24_14805 [Nocardioides sp. Root224]
MVAAGVLLVVLLVTWAASIGPSGVLRGDGPGAVRPTTEQTTATAAPQPQPKPVKDERGDGGGGYLWIAALLINIATAVLAVALLVWLVRWLARVRRVRRARRRREAAVDAADIDVLSPGEAVARELLADVDAQRSALSGGAPRNGIVECWHRFEVSAAAAGIERRPWETSSEHTLRVLDLVDADPAAVSRLAALYREARFSEHELTETHRAAAVEALDRIHHTIGAPA